MTIGIVPLWLELLEARTSPLSDVNLPLKSEKGAVAAEFSSKVPRVRRIPCDAGGGDRFDIEKTRVTCFSVSIYTCAGSARDILNSPERSFTIAENVMVYHITSGGMNDDGAIKSVFNAFEIVEVLSFSGGLTASGLADELDIPVSTAHNYLNTLTQTGFVVREENRYFPSTRFLEIGERRRQRMAVVKAASSELPNLAEETGEHISLMIEENGMGVLISLDKGNEAINIDAFRGVRMPLHTVAPGKAILSELPEERVEEIIDQHGLDWVTKNTITDRDRLYEELERTRERGYAVDKGERMSGMTCIAAPVLDRNDEVRAAVCVCSPSHRVDDDRFEEITKAVQRSANVVQVNLDYS